MHRVTHKSHFRREDGQLVEYEEGDELELTDDEARTMPDRFEEVNDDEESEEESETEESEGEESEESEGELPDPDDHTVSEFEELLESGDYDDRLDELEAREAEGQGRSGISDVIEERR